MDEQGCPRCKTTKYRNPSLKLLVNVCGHSLCENCVDLLFIRGSGACPECNTALRRNNFRVQLFEDTTVEKEVDIRKRILKDFNQRESDFSSLNEYNDYLEMVETLIYNLSNNIDVESTKRRIENYRKDNKEQIMKNRSKVSQDEEYLDMLLDEEIQNTEKRLKETFENEQKEKQLKRKNKELLLDELMSSDLPAQYIMASHKDLLEPTSGVPKAPTTQFSTGIKIGHHQDKYLPIPATESAPLYQYTPLLITMLGPKVPTVQELQLHGYLKNIRSATAMELAGGFHDTVGCKRALEDAFCGLYF
ncbi:CDK-activating kinase assembly factor MAT1 isoform X1 [Octopus bimaculoides]|uniref:CDK-activating kinase assembly factor MAT1 n=1 Tax=Octopus bimaculoides TaxID=37653 RepID=A0A0L8GZA1_OCTBM|nr:CDK-activating kinase assembly factor MAT1 isoform X1 [Octopus bimaculoides]|eukprot:XP_014776810.1 PREDICTED: CDK-activating kinase assembly factor MAT1-like [Octopus bimaculoides]